MMIPWLDPIRELMAAEIRTTVISGRCRRICGVRMEMNRAYSEMDSAVISFGGIMVEIPQPRHVPRTQDPHAPRAIPAKQAALLLPEALLSAVSRAKTSSVIPRLSSTRIPSGVCRIRSMTTVLMMTCRRFMMNTAAVIPARETP